MATNLAVVAARAGRSVAYLDCDVEEPNGHIFLKPEMDSRSDVSVPVPRVDSEACTLCGRCGEICRYSAIVCVGEKVLVYPELCHSCGGCSVVCPVDAIEEVPRPLGRLGTGHAGDIRFAHGLLNIGQAMSPPLIRAVKAAGPDVELTIVDAPPGTSCPVIESIRGCDPVLLVTEPTPFGLNDLRLAVEMVRALELPFGVVINRVGMGDDEVARFCRQKRIDVLAEIPDDRAVAESYSRGQMACEAVPGFTGRFTDLLARIERPCST